MLPPALRHLLVFMKAKKRVRCQRIGNTALVAGSFDDYVPYGAATSLEHLTAWSCVAQKVGQR